MSILLPMVVSTSRCTFLLIVIDPRIQILGLPCYSCVTPVRVLNVSKAQFLFLQNGGRKRVVREVKGDNKALKGIEQSCTRNGMFFRLQAIVELATASEKHMEF